MNSIFSKFSNFWGKQFPSIVPIPSSPKVLQPKEYTNPSSDKQIVNKSPQEICLIGGIISFCGSKVYPTTCALLFPIPSWPNELSPKVNTKPFLDKQTVWPEPQQIDVIQLKHLIAPARSSFS